MVKNKESGPPEKASLHVLFVFADSPSEWNCSQWRCLTPADAMNRANEKFGATITAKLIHVSAFLDFLNPSVQDIVARSHVIVFQRNLIQPSAFDAITYWQGMGKPVVVDLDDAYHILPYSNPAHRFWLDVNSGEAIKTLEKGLGLCQGLIAPNRLLLSDWSHVTPGYYLPNFAEKGWWEKTPSREEMKKKLGLEGRTVIGWGGSVSHYDSWWGSGLFQAAKRISDRHPNVTWMICGNDPRIVRHLPVSVGQKHEQPGVAPEQWPSIVKTFDIGVAPLFGPYDQRRSWIKGLEYLLAGVPWIGTKGEPYRDLAHLGTLIPNGEDVWEEAIEDMLAELPEKQKLAKAQVQVAEQWYAENQIETYRALFESVLQNYAQEATRVLPGVYYV